MLTVLLYVLAGVLLTILLGLAGIGLWTCRYVWRQYRADQAHRAQLLAELDRVFMSATVLPRHKETRH